MYNSFKIDICRRKTLTPVLKLCFDLKSASFILCHLFHSAPRWVPEDGWICKSTRAKNWCKKAAWLSSVSMWQTQLLRLWRQQRDSVSRMEEHTCFHVSLIHSQTGRPISFSLLWRERAAVFIFVLFTTTRLAYMFFYLLLCDIYPFWFLHSIIKQELFSRGICYLFYTGNVCFHLC